MQAPHFSTWIAVYKIPIHSYHGQGTFLIFWNPMDFQPANIIIRLPNWIGDLVMATPVLADVRRAFPKAHITAMCKHPLCELLREDPDIDEIFCFTRPSGFLRRSENRNVIEKLKRGKYDLGILLTHSFSSAWWFFRGGVKNRYGYAGKLRDLLLTKKLSMTQEILSKHQVLVYKNLLKLVDIPISETAPRLFLKDKEIDEAKKNLARLGIPEKAKIVGINPGAAYGSAKCWLPDRFRSVTERLIKDPHIYVVYFGDPQHIALTKEICQGLGSKVVNFAGLTSLRQLSCLLKCCDVLLTNDSGPMHIADALRVPVVALFGSTNERLTGPYNKGFVIHKHVECSPCFQRVCPLDFRCMKRIEVEEVFDAVMRILNA
jgi:heptosyltransferase II